MAWRGLWRTQSQTQAAALPSWRRPSTQHARHRRSWRRRWGRSWGGTGRTGEATSSWPGAPRWTLATQSSSRHRLPFSLPIRCLLEDFRKTINFNGLQWISGKLEPSWLGFTGFKCFHTSLWPGGKVQLCHFNRFFALVWSLIQQRLFRDLVSQVGPGASSGVDNEKLADLLFGVASRLCQVHLSGLYVPCLDCQLCNKGV